VKLKRGCDAPAFPLGFLVLFFVLVSGAKDFSGPRLLLEWDLGRGFNFSSYNPKGCTEYF
jgi:hypothetical protein